MKEFYNMPENEIFLFLKAVRKNIPENKPENYGKVVNFTCPICGKTAACVRSEYNGHIHAKCEGCGSAVIE